MWVETLRKEVAAKGLKQAGKELGVSKTTVSLVCQGKYPSDTRKIQERVEAIYGNGGKVACPALGEILPDRCAETWERAKKIGSMVSNPETLRLYKSCLKCAIRR